MHALTHSRTDRPKYRMPPALFFNGGGGTKMCQLQVVKLIFKHSTNNISSAGADVAKKTKSGAK